MSDRDLNVTRAGRTALPGPLPYAGQGTPSSGEMPGQARVRSGRATPARDYTASPTVLELEVRQGRGRRAQSHVDDINHAVDPLRALRASQDALTSVIAKAFRENSARGAGWAWTVIHLIDRLNVLIEHGRKPHPWFVDRRNWRLNPAGWAPPGALAEVADRIAGRPAANGESK